MRKGILAIGNLLVDRTLVVEEYPKESMLTTISEIAQHCGGGCTNVLFNLAKLDPSLPLFLAGAIGNDELGQFILNQASLRQVNIDAVVQMDLPTSFTDVMINRQTGDRTFFHYVGAMANYLPEHIINIDHPAKIAHIAYLPLLPAILDREKTSQILTALRHKGLLISIDLVSVANQRVFTEIIRPLLPLIDFVIINDVEAKSLVGKNSLSSSQENLYMITRQIADYGVRNSVIIHSPEWAIGWQQGKMAAVASYWVEKSQIVSTLGAGDAFCTGVLYGLHQEFSLEQSLKLGHSLAYFNLFSLSATDGAIDYPRLLQFIQKQAQPDC